MLHKQASRCKVPQNTSTLFSFFRFAMFNSRFIKGKNWVEMIYCDKAKSEVDYVEQSYTQLCKWERNYILTNRQQYYTVPWHEYNDKESD